MKTTPRHWLDYTLRPLLKIIWEPFSRKQSHWWHWRDYKFEGTGISVLGDENEDKRDSVWSNLRLTNFGWKNIVIFRPPDNEPYQIGYQRVEGGKRVSKLCSVALSGDSAALIGPGETLFFFLSFPAKTQKPVDVIRKTTKRKLEANTALV